MERRLPQFEIVQVGRRDAVHFFVRMARVIEQTAQARMRFELPAVGHVNGVCRNIINRSPAVIAACRVTSTAAQIAVVSSRRGKLDRSTLAEKLLENILKNCWLVRR